MNNMKLLQLFADGGAGAGTGAAPTGASEAAAPAQTSRQRLEALGVPKDKIRDKTEGTSQVPTSAEPADEPRAKPSWDELMQDPDYNQEMQRIVKERLKASKAAQEQMNKLAPALEVLSRFYGVEATDLDALAAAVNEDDRFYARQAEQMGVPPEIARRMDQLERQEERHAAEERLAAHVRSLRQQEAQLQKTFPGFSLAGELDNPVFRRLTAPGSGVSLEDAFYAVHHAQLQSAAAQVTARTVAEKLSDSMRANARRPVEAGTVSQTPALSSVDYSRMSQQERAALKQRIRNAAARGQKLYPGQ